MDLQKITYGAFGRSSSAIAMIVIVAFAVMILSTTYQVLAFTRTEFSEKREVQGYENEVENIRVMDEWTRTQYYWSNNLKVAGFCAAGAPVYLGLDSVVATNYMAGMSFTYYYHHAGPEGMLAFSSMIFIHGLLELTGVYIIVAVSLRVAWNLWKGLGRLIEVRLKRERWSWRLSKLEKREILKHKPAIKLLVTDFLTLLAIGALLIFLAAPIEAYVSPKVGGIFYLEPLLAVVFLVTVGFFYGFIVARGFGAVRGDLKLVRRDLGFALKGKWRPTQLSLLMLAVFLFVGLARLVF